MKPHVILNSAISVDGKIATITGESRLSSSEDLRRVHRLRARVDAIMIGLGTLLVDDPKLEVKHFHSRKPVRIVVDSLARTPLGSYVVRTAKKTSTLIAVTTRAPKGRVQLLEEAGAVVLRCGRGRLVSLTLLLSRLRREFGIRRLLLEGGGTLNWSMLKSGLVDDLIIAISPRILGGAHAVTLADGEGFARVEKATRLQLMNARKYGVDLVLSYRVLG